MNELFINLFPFIAEWYFIYKYYTTYLYIHMLKDIWVVSSLGQLQVWVYAFICLVQIIRSGMTGSYNGHVYRFNFLRIWKTVFQALCITYILMSSV